MMVNITVYLRMTWDAASFDNGTAAKPAGARDIIGDFTDRGTLNNNTQIRRIRIRNSITKDFNDLT
jgi:hypothetical protein